MFKRIFTIVIDSVGCGEEPRSPEFGDYGVNTIRHISQAYKLEGKELHLPNMEKLGYGNLTDIIGVKPNQKPIGAYGKMHELSNGKDTMTGHWEIMGLEVKKPFQTFTDTGFPEDLMQELERQTGHQFLGNKAASGTEILKELGEEHIKTKKLIIYTSSDSVLQLAAHEKYFGLDELYRCCKIAREITLQDKWKVGRVIARPFLGESADTFTRTANRHDYALAPFARTVLNDLKDNGLASIGIGKISDIYCGEGITESHRNLSNHHGMEQMIEFADKEFTGSCYLNLVDFDAMYGHRRDPIGYAKCLEEFDQQLGELMAKMKDDDLIMITADHGNDPTYKGTDHTREYVPILVYGKKIKPVNLGTRESFADLGATIAENFKLPKPAIGKSFLKEIL